MKRFLCPQHAHLLKDKVKPIQLDHGRCSVCHWENRPITLKDLARTLEDISYNMRFAAEDEYHDPFGYTWAGPFEDAVLEYLNMIHKDYRKNFLEKLKKAFE